MTIEIMNTGNYNTNYYRRNKKLKFCVHKCPHCDYKTTGPKSSIQHHVWAKHTPESEKPFSCPCESCPRNFASKANLLKHLKSKHDIDLPKHKRILALKIEAHGEKQEKYIIPKSQNQIIQLLFDKYINKKNIVVYTRHSLLKKFGYLN